MKEIQAPNPFEQETGLTIFLAGSIEQNAAEQWQQKIINECSDLDVTFINPRRSDWDPAWDQSVDNPELVRQVNWELDALDFCDVIVLYFDPKTMSPISLLELGRHVESEKRMFICCPDGFWRKGNVQVMCNRNSRILLDKFDDLVYTVQLYINAYSLGRQSAKNLLNLFSDPKPKNAVKVTLGPATKPKKRSLGSDEHLVIWEAIESLEPIEEWNNQMSTTEVYEIDGREYHVHWFSCIDVPDIQEVTYD